MALPNYDALNIQHSRNLADPVAAATADGNIWTSAQRDNHINIACRRWQAWMVGKFLLNENLGKDSSFQLSALDGYINEGSGALTANVRSLAAWTPAVWIVLAAYNNTGAVPIYPLRFQRDRFMGSTGGLSSLAPSSTFQQYALDGGQIRVLGSGATDTINLRYIAAHTDLVAGGGSTVPVFDDSFTATGTAITNFSGVLPTHVNGILVGLDSGANFFVRTITAYVSATAFTISSAVTNGTATNGYIIPSSATSDILVPPAYWGTILDLALAVAKEELATTEAQAIAQNKTGMAVAQINQD